MFKLQMLQKKYERFMLKNKKGCFSKISNKHSVHKVSSVYAYRAKYHLKQEFWVAIFYIIWSSQSLQKSKRNF